MRPIPALLTLALVLLPPTCSGGGADPRVGMSVEVKVSGEDTTVIAHVPGKQASVKLTKAAVKQAIIATLQGDICVGVLAPDCEDTLRLYRVRGKTLREFWRGIPKRLNPWKVQIGDVDGDGNEDIGLGVYKKARFHPVMAKRPFIYGWDGKDVYAKWLGSRLSRPFTDFALASFKEGVRLVAVEVTRDGKNELAVYRWQGFGFIGDWQGAQAKRMSNLEATGGKGKQSIKVCSDGVLKTYIWNGKALEPGD